MKKYLKFSIAFVLTLVLISYANAQVTVYTDFSAWQAALSGFYILEDFSDGAFDPGITAVTTGPGAGEFGYIANQRWEGRVLPGSQTVFSFPINQLAFGGMWDLAGPGGPGMGIRLNTPTTFVYEISNQTQNSFVGFISTQAFSSVELTNAYQVSGWCETYYMDDMVYSPIPEPGSLLLLGSGLFGFGAISLYRRKKK
jgi:hypothetical protein